MIIDLPDSPTVVVISLADEPMEDLEDTLKVEDNLKEDLELGE